MADGKSVVGTWADPYEWMDACRAVRAANCKGIEGWAPYPKHGMEEALGIKRSWIGRPVLFMLLTGAFLGFMMQYWMMKVDWPINIGGKPYNSWPQFVVITFECGILFGALTNFMLALATSKMRPKLNSEMWRDDLHHDAFALAIPLTDANPGEAELHALLGKSGAESIGVYDTSIETTQQAEAAKQGDADNAPAGEPNHA
jgi:hypothetical protein